MSPSVSVVVTTYNQAAYIGAAIASVLNQTYQDFEVVLVDDGSTDDTSGAVSPYRDRLVYIRQRNRGVAAARNVGIRHAIGRMIAFLDGDDLWEPEKLTVQMEAAEAHPGTGMIVADGVEFSRNGILRESLIGPSILPLLRERSSITLRCYEELIRNNLICTTSQVMVPRWIIERVGLSDERFALSSDWDLYLRIAAETDVTFLNRRLVRYRYLSTSASGPYHLRYFRWGLDVTRILRKHLRLAAPGARTLVRSQLGHHTRVTARAAYDQSIDADRDWGRHYLLRLLVANPRCFPVAAYLLGLCVPRSLNRRLAPMVRRVFK